MKKILLVFAVLALGFYLLQRRRGQPAVIEQIAQKEDKQLQLLGEGGPEPSRKSGKANMKALRELRAMEFKLGIDSFYPLRSGDQCIFEMIYEPMKMGYLEGDLDIIQSTMDPEQDLIWIWENASGKAVQAPRLVKVRDLHQAFRQKVKLKCDERAEFYTLSLCVTPTLDSCKGSQAADYEEILKDFKIAKKQSHRFFIQSFLVDGKRIKVFNSRSFKEQLAKFNKIEGLLGSPKKIEDIKSALQMQEKIRALPVLIKSQSIVVRLMGQDPDFFKGP